MRDEKPCRRLRGIARDVHGKGWLMAKWRAKTRAALLTKSDYLRANIIAALGQAGMLLIKKGQGLESDSME